MVRVQCILSTLAAIAIQVRAQQREFRLFYRFGFGDGKIGEPAGTPTRQDVDALMCTTAKFLTDSLMNYTGNRATTVITENVDWGYDNWIYNGTEPEAPKNVPVIVNFTAVASTTDGSRLSSDYADTNEGTLNLLWEATKHFDYFKYIMDYIWKINSAGSTQNFFVDTHGMWYEPLRVDPVTDAMMETPPSCPSSTPPAPGRGVPLSLGTPTLVPSKAPFSRAAGLDIPTETLAPTRKIDEMVYFSIQIDFFSGLGREPTEEEVNAMMCEVDKFFQRELEKSPFFSNKQGIETNAVEINYDYDAAAASDLPSVVLFFSNSTYIDGGERVHIPANDVFDTFEVADVASFVENYIWQSAPYKENIFYQTEDIYFGGSYTGSPIPPEPTPGKIKKATCPAT